MADEEIPLKEDNELVLLLHSRYGIKTTRAYTNYYSKTGGYNYFSAEDIAEIEGNVRYGRTLDGQVNENPRVVVHEQGADYSEVDPEVNPMSVVFEFQFPEGSRYLLVSGYYVSHDGGYWDDYREVKREVKTVVVYE